MSGFEIIGVVLGALPLLISGLEHYNEGLVPIKHMLQYEYAVKEIVRALNVARSRLRNTCEMLLTGLVDDQEIAQFLDITSLNGDAWKRPDLDHKLHERLGESYEGYMATIAHLAQKIFVFGKKMGLDSKFRPTWIDQPSKVRTRSVLFGEDLKRKSARLWKRVKLGLDYNEFEELIIEMAHENSQLEILTRGNIELEPIRRARSRDVDMKYWKITREFALRLYNCLTCRWPCRCGFAHRANLRLEIREIADTAEGETFGVVFVFSDDETMEQSAPWKWLNTEIRSVEVPDPQETQQSLPKAQSTGRTVTFGTLPSRPISQKPPQKTSNVPSTENERIMDLCTAFAGQHAESCSLGYLDDERWQHHIHLTSQNQITKTLRSAISLHQILDSESTVQHVIITPRDRYGLALLLASNILQLYNTPWLNDNWSRDDIYVLQTLPEKSLARKIYVSKSFSALQTRFPAEADPDVALLRNPSVFNLGLALLELTYGNPIEHFETEKDLRNGIRTVMTNMLVAQRLVGQIEEYEGKRYSDVVYRCIYCDFGCRVTSFESVEFRQKFYSGVVLPLEEILNDFVR